MSAPVAQPSKDCGPPMEAIISGMVMKGPMPTMLEIFRAVAWSKPKARVSWGDVSLFVAIDGQVGALQCRAAAILSQWRESTYRLLVCQSDCLFLIDCDSEDTLSAMQIVHVANTIGAGGATNLTRSSFQEGTNRPSSQL